MGERERERGGGGGGGQGGEKRGVWENERVEDRDTVKGKERAVETKAETQWWGQRQGGW